MQRLIYQQHHAAFLASEVHIAVRVDHLVKLVLAVDDGLETPLARELRNELHVFGPRKGHPTDDSMTAAHRDQRWEQQVDQLGRNEEQPATVAEGASRSLVRRIAH